MFILVVDIASRTGQANVLIYFTYEKYELCLQENLLYLKIVVVNFVVLVV